MRTHKILFTIVLLASFVACGSQSNVNDNSNNSKTGTVEILGDIGSSGANSSLSYLTTQEAADEVLVRTYRVSLGDAEDCEAASFVDIFDETDDTSDCVVDPDDTSLFLDIADAPTMGINDAIPAGTYSCVRITICDQLVWSSAALDDYCPGTNFSDITDPRDEASTKTFYYSTAVEELVNDEDAGAIDQPFPLTEALEVIAGDTTTVTFLMSNSDLGDGMIAEYDSEDDEEFQCEIPAPQMTIESE